MEHWVEFQTDSAVEAKKEAFVFNVTRPIEEILEGFDEAEGFSLHGFKRKVKSGWSDPWTRTVYSWSLGYRHFFSGDGGCRVNDVSVELRFNGADPSEISLSVQPGKRRANIEKLCATISEAIGLPAYLSSDGLLEAPFGNTVEVVDFPADAG